MRFSVSTLIKKIENYKGIALQLPLQKITGFCDETKFGVSGFHHINIEIALSPPSHFDTFINILNSYTIYIHTHTHTRDRHIETYKTTTTK